VKITPTRTGGQGLSVDETSPRGHQSPVSADLRPQPKFGVDSPLPDGARAAVGPSGAPRFAPDELPATIGEGALERSPCGDSVAAILARMQEATRTEDADAMADAIGSALRLMADAEDPTVAALVALRAAIDEQIAIRVGELRRGMAAAAARANAGGAA
jgi:hypothetical protein